MSRPQQALELSSMSGPQQASELSSMSGPQQASELPSMSGPQSATMLSSTQESTVLSMPRGSLQSSGAEEGSSSLGWFHAPRARDENRSALEPGQACGSPVSVDALQPPLESLAAVPSSGGGLVIGAPPVGLVMVDGVWREYRMIRGQMVVQPSHESGPGAASASLLRGCGGQQEWQPPCPLSANDSEGCCCELEGELEFRGDSDSTPSTYYFFDELYGGFGGRCGRRCRGAILSW